MEEAPRFHDIKNDLRLKPISSKNSNLGKAEQVIYGVICTFPKTIRTWGSQQDRESSCIHLFILSTNIC